MSACHGGMFILVNVDKHREVVGDIANYLISKFGVPISMVDDIQKICPKCCQSPSEPSNTSKTDTSSSPIAPAPPTSTSEDPIHVEEDSGSSTASESSEATAPEAKRARIEEEFPMLRMTIKEDSPVLTSRSIKIEQVEEEEVITIDDNVKEVFGTVLATMQNGHTSEHGSDDGASNSIDHFDVEEDDYNPVPWADSTFLANFITSQPDIFHATRGAPQESNTPSAPKLRAPPIVTASGKTRRGRIVYSQQELNILEQYYVEDPNACANPIKKDMMCKKLDIDYHRLKVWFQNRRRKDKVRSQEEAAAGSASAREVIY